MIWVHSKSVQVVEALAIVFKEYEDFLTSKSILIHHAFEDNEDLCKKICIQKLRALNKIIMSLDECVPITNLKEIVHRTASITLSESNIRQLCYNILEHEGTNVGTTDDCSYPCSDSSILNRQKEQLENKILEQISKSFVDEIYRLIFTNIQSKVQTNLKTGLLDLKVNISPELIAIGTSDTEYADVDFVSWNTKIAGQIYEQVCLNRALIEEELFSKIKTMCTKTKEDLQTVSMKINNLEQRIGFPDQETCTYGF